MESSFLKAPELLHLLLSFQFAGKYYFNAKEYDSLRFVGGRGVRAKDGVRAKGSGDKEAVRTPYGDEARRGHNPNDMITISDAPLSWGYGRLGW